jgi:hypothetical protein
MLKGQTRYKSVRLASSGLKSRCRNDRGEQRQQDYFDTHTAPSHSRHSSTLTRHQHRFLTFRPPFNRICRRHHRRYYPSVTHRSATFARPRWCCGVPQTTVSAPEPTQQHTRLPRATLRAQLRRHLRLAPLLLRATSLCQRVHP